MPRTKDDLPPNSWQCHVLSGSEKTALFGLHLPQKQEGAPASIIHWYTEQHQCACKFVSYRHPPCVFLCFTYQSSPCKPVGMQHGCAESNHLEMCLQVDNFVGSQPVGICRKENETVSVYAVLFSWPMSTAAGPTCRYGLLSRSPEARGNWVWCYTGRNNLEQQFSGVVLHKAHLDMDRIGSFW